MTTFQVGDIAILVYDRCEPHYAGQEVEIIKPLGTYAPPDEKPFQAYEIRTADSRVWTALPDQLRPRNDDSKTKIEWSECIWQPAPTHMNKTTFKPYRLDKPLKV